MLAPVLAADFLGANKTHNYLFLNLSVKFVPHYGCCKDRLSYTPSAYLKLGKMAGEQQEV